MYSHTYVDLVCYMRRYKALGVFMQQTLFAENLCHRPAVFRFPCIDCQPTYVVVRKRFSEI